MRRHSCFMVILAAGLTSWAACGGDGPGDTPDSGPNLQTPSFEVIHEPVNLTASARQAVAAVPAWLQDDLTINFGKLDEAHQDELAALIHEVASPYQIDEVAFVIAHTSPEVLMSEQFHSELIALNASLIYAHDEVLGYVELVEVGEPGVDADYHTTTRYRVETSPGTIEEVTIDRELYYWYIVHPRLEDELPLFIDGWSGGQPVSPTEGWFWREFLWDAAAEGCPVGQVCPLLSDKLGDVEVFRQTDEDSVFETNTITRVWDFVHEAMSWGAIPERPIQPTRIYAVGCGHCGEHADLFVAATRTALVPCQNVGASANDHTWGEWWHEQWWGEFGKYAGGVRRDRRDNDCDTVADDALDDTDEDADGWTVADGDCDDTDENVNPDASEVQNGRDDDCDGTADTGFVDADLDGDGDGWSIADGDCDDTDAAISPDATEPVNGRDDDCDGIADDGTDATDLDADGHSILDGDCDDNNPDVYPNATEVGNGRDDNCDGTADEGLLDGSDRDGDGYTMAQGDCNDLDPGTHPSAADPGLSNNRLYAISSARGDSFVSLERTESYGTLKSELEILVRDANGEPVDGAEIWVVGTWAVYGEPETLVMAGELFTDLDGRAWAQVGEYNPYYYKVISEAGWYPEEENLVSQAVEQTVAHQRYTMDVALVGTLPTRPAATTTDLFGNTEPQASLAVGVTVESYRISGDGRHEGSFSYEHPGGRLDILLVDDTNLNRFWNDEPFEAHVYEQGVGQHNLALDIPLDRRWTVILSNHHVLASTMVGTLTATVTPLAGNDWPSDDGPVTLDRRFHIPPGGMLALSLVP